MFVCVCFKPSPALVKVLESGLVSCFKDVISFELFLFVVSLARMKQNQQLQNN